MTIVEKLISVAAPHYCLGCSAEGQLLCAWCLPDARLELPERCYRCSRQSPGSAVCPACRKVSRLKHVWVSSEYGGLPKEIMHYFKFERAQAAAQPIAKLMAEVLPYLPSTVLITHVPTASRRRRTRGYDHAELLARALARMTNHRFTPLLGRLGQTRQVGAKREKRISQMDGAFRPLKPYLLSGAHILLVDDILTTGATIEAAARTLRQAGAKTVDAIVFAQKN